MNKIYHFRVKLLYYIELGYSSLASRELGTEKAFREKSCLKISAIICMVRAPMLNKQ